MRILPLLLVLIFGFVVPIGYMTSCSISSQKLVDSLPLTTQSPSYENLVLDLKSEKSRGAILYMNFYYPGARTMFTTARKKVDDATVPYSKWFRDMDPRWGDPKLWSIIERHKSGYTLDNLKKATSGVYWEVLKNTFYLGSLITLVTLILSYPTAMFLTTIKNKWVFGIGMFCILLPFFSSYLSRIVSWMVLLPPLGLIYNTTGIFIGSVYILLPLCILPIYVSMKNINYDIIDASRVCGSNKLQTFLYAYLPQTKLGILNGGLISFITVIGFFTTPALLGGGEGKFVTEQIVYHIEQSLNWGLASALTAIMSFIVFVLFILYVRMNRVK